MPKKKREKSPYGWYIWPNMGDRLTALEAMQAETRTLLAAAIGAPPQQRTEIVERRRALTEHLQEERRKLREEAVLVRAGYSRPCDGTVFLYHRRGLTPGVGYATRHVSQDIDATMVRPTDLTDDFLEISRSTAEALDAELVHDVTTRFPRLA